MSPLSRSRNCQNTKSKNYRHFIQTLTRALKLLQAVYQNHSIFWNSENKLTCVDLLQTYTDITKYTQNMEPCLKWLYIVWQFWQTNIICYKRLDVNYVKNVLKSYQNRLTKNVPSGEWCLESNINVSYIHFVSSDTFLVFNLEWSQLPHANWVINWFIAVDRWQLIILEYNLSIMCERFLSVICFVFFFEFW